MDILERIIQHDTLESEIEDYFKPKLVKLLVDGKLNSGKYPKNKKPESVVFLKSFECDKKGIRICYEIDWGGRADSDYGSISLLEEEWSNI